MQMIDTTWLAQVYGPPQGTGIAVSWMAVLLLAGLVLLLVMALAGKRARRLAVPLGIMLAIWVLWLGVFSVVTHAPRHVPTVSAMMHEDLGQQHMQAAQQRMQEAQQRMLEPQQRVRDAQQRMRVPPLFAAAGRTAAELPAPQAAARADQAVAQVRAEAGRAAAQVQAEATPIAESLLEWQQAQARQQLFSDMTGEFVANVYPSDAAAVRALAARLARRFDQVLPQGQGPEAIEIFAAPEVRDRVPQALLTEVAEVLRRFHPQVKVSVVTGPGLTEGVQPAGGTVMVALTVATPTELAFDTMPHRAPASVAITGAAGRVSESALYTNDPWAGDLAKFIAHNPHHNWMVGFSQQPAMSSEEAQAQAAEVLAGKLESLVRDRMAQAGPRRGQRVAWDSPWLTPRILADLRSGAYVADRFVQQVQRPYGNFWQAALLVDASSETIGQMADRYLSMLTIQRQSFRQTVWAVAGVVALVCVVYVFLNSATKGYFSWSLRAAAVAMIAAGIFLVLLLSA